MSNIIPFSYGENAVRVVMKDNEPWWVLKDVCDSLGLSDTSKVAERLDDDELTRTIIVSGGQNREMYAVNESGVYSVIFQSRKPEAKIFKRWVTHEVLPSIRKTGMFSTTQSYIEAAKLIARTPTARVEYVINCFEAAGLMIRKEKPKKMSFKEFKATIPDFDQLSNAEQWAYYNQWEAEQNVIR